MKRAAILFLSAVFLMTSCSTPSTKTAQTKKAKEPDPEPVGAMKAFYRMYQLGRTLSPDIDVLKLESISLNSVASKDGLYPAWRAYFVSPSKRAGKAFTYSVIEGEGLYKDVFGGHEESYSGPRGQTAPFPHLALKIDSDAAYQTAVEKSEAFLKKNPDLPVFMVLEKVKEFGSPVWRVYWGASMATSSYSIYVDASTGHYLKTMR